jgi:hypothetical protein
VVPHKANLDVIPEKNGNGFFNTEKRRIAGEHGELHRGSFRSSGCSPFLRVRLLPVPVRATNSAPAPIRSLAQFARLFVVVAAASAAGAGCGSGSRGSGRPKRGDHPPFA